MRLAAQEAIIHEATWTPALFSERLTLIAFILAEKSTCGCLHS